VAARGSYVYSAGATRNSSNNLDLIVMRWSSLTGAFKWAKRYAGAAKMDDEATDVVIDGNGNAIVCGTTENAAGRTSWVVRKYTPAGDKKWTWTYDGSALTNDTPTEMVVDSSNNIYVTGHTQQDAVLGFFTVKLSPTGAKLWSRKYRGFDDLGGTCWAIARCPSGGVYVGGIIQSATTSYDAVVLRYSAAGTRTVFEYFTAGNDATWESARDIAVASDGKVFAVGSKDESDPMWVAWLPYGGLQSASWETTAGYDSWEAVATDSYGGVYIAGPYDNVSVNPNIRTFRSSVLPGGGGWMYDYDGNGYDRSFGALAVSGLSVAVVGRQYNGSNYDQYVHIWTY
ncbi:MAG: SBBP repeat-containing protein, partial [Thermoleophilia bacterium]|nr:SBBP repeat-containing protein [Thermoleophilia bacterium]